MIATSKGMTGKNRALIRNQPKLICKETDGIKIYLSPLVVGEWGWGWTEHWTGEQNGARGRRAGGAGRAGVTDSDARSVGTSIEATATRKNQIWCRHLRRARSRIRVRAWTWAQRARRLEGAYSVRRGEWGGVCDLHCRRRTSLRREDGIWA